MLKLTWVQILILVLAVAYMVVALPVRAATPIVPGIIEGKTEQKVLNKASPLSKGFSVGPVGFYCGPVKAATVSRKDAQLILSVDTKEPQQIKTGSRVCQVFKLNKT